MSAGLSRSGPTRMTNVSIREMQAADRERVIDLLWELNRFENGITGNRALDRNAAAACFRANDARMAEHGGAHFVAMEDATVIGYLCAIVDIAPAFIREESRRHVCVADLVVTEKARGRGIGKSLIQAAEAFTRAKGLKHILIGVVAGNVAADDLYANLGYRTYAIERLKTLD